MQRKILITGTNRGFGYALTKAFINNGDMVFGLVRQMEAVSSLEKEFGKQFIPIVSDVRDEDCSKTIKKVLAKHTNHLDLLINNVGVTGKGYRIDDVDPEEILNVFNVHCVSVIRTYQGAKDFLRKADEPLIINVSSRLGSLTRMASGEFAKRRFAYSYRVAKAAQNMLTICMDQELRNDNIRLVSIHPGRLLTESGAKDADTDPDVGATRLLQWLDTFKPEDTTSYVEPDVGEIPW